MEKRTAKLIVNSPGGTAGKGSKTYKISLPNSWIQEMGLDTGSKSLELSFDGKAIHIAKPETAEEFMQSRRSLHHQLKEFLYYDGDVLCTTIYADYSRQEIAFLNHTQNHIKTAFGNNSAAMWDDFEAFLESRCIPKSRSGIKPYLASLGLSEYDPLSIIRKTQGRMAEDHQWLEVRDIL